jgi:hypothetical protein
MMDELAEVGLAEFGIVAGEQDEGVNLKYSQTV